MELENIIKKLKDHIRVSNVSINNIIKEIGIKPNTYYRIIKGENTPNIRNHLKILNYLKSKGYGQK